LNKYKISIWQLFLFYLIIFSMMIYIYIYNYIKIIYNQHMNIDHVYVNCGVWTLSKVGDQAFYQFFFSLIQSEVNFIWNIFHFKLYTNVKFEIQCFIDILSKWNIWNFIFNFFSKMYTFIYFFIKMKIHLNISSLWMLLHSNISIWIP